MFVKKIHLFFSKKGILCVYDRTSTMQTKPPLCRPCLRYAVPLGILELLVPLCILDILVPDILVPLGILELLVPL